MVDGIGVEPMLPGLQPGVKPFYDPSEKNLYGCRGWTNMVGELQESILQDIPGHTNNIPAGIKRRSEPYHRQRYPSKIFRPLTIINLLSCQLGAVLFLKVHLVGRVSSHLYCGENRLPPSPVRILLPISRPQRSPGSIRANAVIREVFFFWIRNSANRQTTRTSYN